jgi:hypothetical protein
VSAEACEHARDLEPNVFALIHRSFILVVAVLACSAACNHDEEARAEARGLLERLNKLSTKGTLTDRKQALDALDAFSIREPQHAQARDVCRSAHSQLLQAEAMQVSARKALDEATKDRAPGSPPMSSERGLAIAADLKKSTAALASAQLQFPKCEQATIALTREAR